VKINDSVYMLDCTPQSHSYLILGREPMLVDTCLPGKGPKILAELAVLGVKAQEIKHILLTHYDIDHIGSAAFLQRATGAVVWAPAQDIPYILGEKSRPGIKKYLGFFMRAQLPRNIQPYPPSNRLGELEVIATPGHTPGHVSFLYQDVFFAGDMVATSRGQINPPPAVMTWNMPLALQSIEKVKSLAFRWVCPAHGMPLERGSML